LVAWTDIGLCLRHRIALNGGGLCRKKGAKMPKSALLTIKIAVAITVLTLAGIGILGVCHVIPREELLELILRTLAVMGILTAASLAVACLMGAGRKQP
jgi:hypothetical protein